MPKRVFQSDVMTYVATLKTVLTTTRFNNKTWNENQEYLKRCHEEGVLSKKIQCIYPCSVVISATIPYQSNMFVLEMNNETNKMMGIGLVKNITPEYNKHVVYENERYNAFTYQGGYHIGVGEMTEEEKMVISKLEMLCFKGKRHQKRMVGIKAFPMDILYNYKNRQENSVDFIQEITKMFKTRFL